MFWFTFVSSLSEVSGAWTLWSQQKGVWLVDHKAHSWALACLGHGMPGCTCLSAFLLLSCLNACSGAPRQLPLFWHASVLLKDPKCLSELLAQLTEALKIKFHMSCMVEVHRWSFWQHLFASYSELLSVKCFTSLPERSKLFCAVPKISSPLQIILYPRQCWVIKYKMESTCDSLIAGLEEFLKCFMLCSWWEMVVKGAAYTCF